MLDRDKILEIYKGLQSDLQYYRKEMPKDDGHEKLLYNIEITKLLHSIVILEDILQFKK